MTISGDLSALSGLAFSDRDTPGVFSACAGFLRVFVVTTALRSKALLWDGEQLSGAFGPTPCAAFEALLAADARLARAIRFQALLHAPPPDVARLLDWLSDALAPGGSKDG